MRSFERVLAALDLGRHGDGLTLGSQKALLRAAWIVQRAKASLTLLHSERPDEYWDARFGRFVDGEGSPKTRRKALEEVADALREAGLDATVHVRSEAAWLAVLYEVLREDIDLVVAAKRTDVHSDDRKLGSVARKLVRKCPATVWLEDPRDDTDLSVILAAVDLSPVGDRVVELSASVAHELGAELHIVHAYSLTLEVQMEGGDARVEYEQRKHAEASERIRSVLAGTSMEKSAELHIGCTSPAHAVIEGVERLNPGLVVMGTVSRGGVPGLLMGNTAERLIDRVDRALLVVKPHDFVCPVELPD